MWETIASIAINYWIPVFFGAVISIGTLIVKKLYKLNKIEQEQRRKEFLEKMEKTIDEKMTVLTQEDKNIYKEINKVHEEVEVLKGGMLSVHGNEFKNQCKRALAEDHEITLEEFDELEYEHAIYNSLGGNHTGDQLFALVKAKFEANLTK